MDYLTTALPYIAENVNGSRITIVATTEIDGDTYLVGVNPIGKDSFMFYSNGFAVNAGFGFDLSRIIDPDREALDTLPEYIVDAARDLLHVGRKISAVKLVRSAAAKRPDGSYISLLTAKNFVEALPDRIPVFG